MCGTYAVFTVSLETLLSNSLSNSIQNVTKYMYNVTRISYLNSENSCTAFDYIELVKKKKYELKCMSSGTGF